jgi:hypothetical protein
MRPTGFRLFLFQFLTLMGVIVFCYFMGIALLNWLVSL